MGFSHDRKQKVKVKMSEGVAGVVTTPWEVSKLTDYGCLQVVLKINLVLYKLGKGYTRQIVKWCNLDNACNLPIIPEWLSEGQFRLKRKSKNKHQRYFQKIFNELMY